MRPPSGFASNLPKPGGYALVTSTSASNSSHSVVRADAQRQRAVPGSQHIEWGDPNQVTRPVKEYLAALDAANPHDPPKYVSLTDPAASWSAASGPAFFAYSTNYLIDVKAGIIVDVEPSTSNHAAESLATRTMIDRVEQRLHLKPHRLIGDAAIAAGR